MDRGIAPPSSPMASILRAYSMPLFIFVVAMFYQLVVLPRSFPPSHYDVLGIKRYSSVETVEEAYKNISSRWDSGSEVPNVKDFIKIQYAYELLRNLVWKRDYDIFGIDEQLHVMDKVEMQYAGKNFSHVELPLLHDTAYDSGDDAFNVISFTNFQSIFQNSKPWLIQVYSSGSNRCAQFSSAWKRIGALMDGVANVGMVEVGDVQLSTYLAERNPTGQAFFRNGLPSLVAFPPHCKTSDCLVRFEGELSIDAVTDWFATTVLNLPRILYYSKESLVPKFLARSGSHKVKAIVFSETGERATPFVRQTAKDYWNYISFAYVLWTKEESSVWWNSFEVESAPAIAFLKDPGVKAVVYHGSFNGSWFQNVLEQNKQLGLPQLRSVTSMELGCDARGYSRAGYDTLTWYCAILVGRQGLELNKMRETMCRVQEMLSSYNKPSAVGNEESMANESMATAAMALKKSRLTFAWLDGEAQEKYCFFYLHSETSYETCGPRRVITDVPRLLIVRYMRNVTGEDNKHEKKPKTIWQLQKEDVDSASQLVVSYNGSAEIPQIIKWISNMVEDGDSKDLPFYRTKTPVLVPEDADPVWSGEPKTASMKRKISSVTNRIYDNLGDPRIGPALLLGALLYSGTIWWARSQPTTPVQSSQQRQLDTNDETRERKRNRRRNVWKKDLPPSITDVEPKDAQQIPFLDSDSE